MKVPIETEKETDRIISVNEFEQRAYEPRIDMMDHFEIARAYFWPE